MPKEMTAAPRPAKTRPTIAPVESSAGAEGGGAAGGSGGSDSDMRRIDYTEESASDLSQKKPGCAEREKTLYFEVFCRDTNFGAKYETSHPASGLAVGRLRWPAKASSPLTCALWCRASVVSSMKAAPYTFLTSPGKQPPRHQRRHHLIRAIVLPSRTSTRASPDTRAISRTVVIPASLVGTRHRIRTQERWHRWTPQNTLM